jgi:hypothetical protein
MSVAFTQIPENFDLSNMILRRHQGLFDMGLCEHHFDKFVAHLEATLLSLAVGQSVIDEGVAVIMTLRPVFANGAQGARDRQNARTMQRAVALVAVTGLVLYGFTCLSRRRS